MNGPHCQSSLWSNNLRPDCELLCENFVVCNFLFIGWKVLSAQTLTLTFWISIKASFVSEPISSSLNASDCGKRSEYRSDFADFVGNCLLSKLLYLPISNSKLRSSFSFTPEVCAGPGVSAQPGWSRSQLGLDSGTKLHEPGRWAGSRHIIYFPGPGLPDQRSIGRELAGSRAGSVILPGTWKIPDIQYS